MTEKEEGDMVNRITDLEGQLRSAQRRYDTLEGRQNSNVVVNSVKDRRIEKFTSGKDIDEWIQNVELYIDKKFESEREKVNFIIDHLHDDVKIEIRLEIDPTRSSSNELLTLLQKIYGVTKTWFELEVEFYARNQQHGETLTQYSHELMKILFLLQKVAADPKDSDKMLKQKFADGVLDVDLQQELKRLNRENSRQLAIDWRSGSRSQAGKMDALVETISIQQNQIDLLTKGMQDQFKKVAEVAEHTHYNRGRGYHRSRGRFRGRSRGRTWNSNGRSNSYPRQNDQDKPEFMPDDTNNDTMICHYCSELNHIATYCWKRMKDIKKSRESRSDQGKNYNHSR